MANTLNPNYEGNELSQMIPDDRFIRHTLNDWYFGADLTGDILKYYNHLDLCNHDFCNDKVSCCYSVKAQMFSELQFFLKSLHLLLNYRCLS